MKIGFLFLFLLTLLDAKTLTIDENFTKQSNIGYGSYTLTFFDDFNTIDKKSFKPIKKPNIGYQVGKYIWTKTKIHNATSKTQKIVAYHPRPGTDCFSIYMFKNEKIFKVYHMGDSKPFSNRPLKSRQSGISFQINPNETITLYTMASNKTTLIAETVIAKANTYLFDEIVTAITTSFLSAIVLIIMIFSGILLFHFNKLSSIIFLLHIFLTQTFYISYNGYIIYLSEGFLTSLSEFFVLQGAIIAMICILLFDLFFFDIKKHSFVAYKVAIFYLILQIIFAISTIYPNSLLGQMIAPYASYMINLILVTAYIFLILLLRAKIPYGRYYVSARFFHYTGIFIYIMAILGKIKENFFTMHIGIIGTILEGMIATFVFYKIIKDKLKEANRTKELLKKHARFLSTGKTLATIIHQWKAPLNRLGTITIYLQSLLLKPKIPHEALSNSINHLQNAISIMDNTITSFYDFYKKDSKPNTFNVHNKIESILDILKPQVDNFHIHVENKTNPQITLFSRADIFGHTLMIILQNAINSLKNCDLQRRVTISSTIENDFLIINVKDNGTGFKKEIIDNFPNHISQSKKGLGIGLGIAHYLVTKELKGRLILSNLPKGALVTIKLNK